MIGAAVSVSKYEDQMQQIESFEASPERIDITIFDIIDMPVLKNGIVDGTVKIVDYAPTGAEDMVRMQAPVEDLLCVEMVDDPHSAVHNIAKARAAMIHRALQRFQHANETPDGHMALETWGGLTPVMCKTLRKVGVRSLQELGMASEATISRMGSAMMSPRKLVEQCQLYLSSMDKAAAAHALVAAREENDALKQRMADMEAMFNAKLSEILAKVGGGDAAPADAPAKRRGRRSNAEIEAERAAASDIVSEEHVEAA